MLNTLKGRLYFLSILIVLPLYFFIYWSFDYSRSMVQEELSHTAQFASNQAAENQEHLVDSTQEFLKSLVSISHLQNPNSDDCQRFIQEITPLFDHYVNIGVPNDKGILTCNGTQLTKAVDVSDRAYINEALAHKHFTSSGVQVDRAMGRPTINFAYPILSSEEGQALGAAVVVISLDWWNELLSTNHLPENSVAYVLDGNGQAVASFPKDIKFTAPDRFNSIWLGSDGVNRIFDKREVLNADGDVQLVFLTGVAVDQSLKRVNERFTLMAVIFSVLLAVIYVLFRVFFINTISKPLSLLSDLAVRLGRNEKVFHTQPTGVREMDDLQRCFVEMAELKLHAEGETIRQAQTDSLTGLPNRDAFTRKLSNSLILASEKGHNLSLVLIDLDNFKEVNDTRGHEIGDEVLKQIAERLLYNNPAAHYIGRIGGDEFVFLVEGDYSTPAHLQSLCQDIMTLIKQPFSVSYGGIVMSASIGVALYPEDGKNIRELMGAADQAMYYAKQCGRDTVRRFSKELNVALLQKIELIKDLRQAITNKEFYLVYQPIVNRKGVVTKFEALIRWQHPEKGLIAPDQFIRFAEESGQIVQIGAWVIEEAKYALQKIRQAYGRDIQISVNVSPIQLSNHQGNTCDFLSSLLTTFCEPEQGKNGLVVEITEHLLMNLDESTRSALLGFREKGIQVALDDFGTGYSSLAYIMNYDIDYLKIDKTFVQKLDDESSSISLCEAIISMAHKLNMSVIAEGVETEEQLDLLIEYGCDYLQGYYFSKPILLGEALTYCQDKQLKDMNAF
ncbi:EAL domain-containing protein [Marinomonas rhizomae]|uniref:Diguanylate cyclase (GGDEF)-like protein n=1 Tax=Marinomonas rhizomae TaxID=491948 RepID=A0A366JAD4_9GAMM|nr:EAL domain-containing protein [Marinomonas rhizomae]RBP83913.1 diguanylate cyclase (GGDEF)-like protein [Marinomonas rhizomae]RNF73383.1 EAL domain-containing protein [Marinomonas rhizomae]